MSYQSLLIPKLSLEVDPLKICPIKLRLVNIAINVYLKRFFQERKLFLQIRSTTKFSYRVFPSPDSLSSVAYLIELDEKEIKVPPLPLSTPGSMGTIGTEDLWMRPFHQYNFLWIDDPELVSQVLSNVLVIVQNFNHLLAIPVGERACGFIVDIPCPEPIHGKKRSQYAECKKIQIFNAYVWAPK